MVAMLWVALEYGITDILTFSCGRRPDVTELDIMAMAMKRFDLNYGGYA